MASFREFEENRACNFPQHLRRIRVNSIQFPEIRRQSTNSTNIDRDWATCIARECYGGRAEGGVGAAPQCSVPRSRAGNPVHGTRFLAYIFTLQIHFSIGYFVPRLRLRRSLMTSHPVDSTRTTADPQPFHDLVEFDRELPVGCDKTDLLPEKRPIARAPPGGERSNSASNPLYQHPP